MSADKPVFQEIQQGADGKKYRMKRVDSYTFVAVEVIEDAAPEPVKTKKKAEGEEL